MKDFIPRPWQKPMIEFGLAQDRVAELARMGMGKTSAVVAITDARLMASVIKRNLVIAPLRVARSTWPEEVAKWEQFKHLKVQTIVGTADQRRAALRNDKADIYTINYENLEWLIETIGPDNWPFDMVTADEATKLKSFRLLQGGKRAQAMAEVAHSKVKCWVNLTGTFAPNGLADLWGQMWFIDRGFRLGRTYDDFEGRWFGYQRAKDAVNAHKTCIARIAFPHAQPEIHERIKDVALALNPKDWFDIADPIVERVYVDLPPEAKKHYREMEREMFMQLKGFDIEVFASSAKVIKCIAEGTEVLTDQGWLPIESVTTRHLLWDGEAWVSTCGLVCHGYMSVVECWGIWMTSDHRVMTTAGWREAQEVLSGESTSRYDRFDVRLPESALPRGVCSSEGVDNGKSNLAVPVRVRGGSSESRPVLAHAYSWLTQVLWMPPQRDIVGCLGYSRHDGAPGVGNVVTDAAALLQPREQGLAQLRGPGNQSLRTLAKIVRRFLGGHGANVACRAYPGTSEEQRRLHPEKLPVGNRERAVQQHPAQRFHSNPRGANDGYSSRRTVRRQEGHVVCAAEARLDDQERSRTAKVFDIVNAGPRHRFTVRGSDGSLLVHNCLQLANGAVYTGSDLSVEQDTAHWVEAHQEKLDALESIIEEASGPVLVVYHFKPDLVRLKARFKKGRHINTKKDEDDFKAGRIPVAFVHPQSIGHGVDGFQTVCNTIVFFAVWWNLENHDQIIERIGPMRQMQSGFNREVMVYLILARGTVDETVDARLVKKRGVQDAVMDSLAYKPRA